MRVVEVLGTGSVHMVRAQEAPLGEHDVRVQVTYCGICGSDLHMLTGEQVPVGLVLGHEITGVVREVGTAAADDWAVGDRVVVRPIEDCLQCDACRSGSGVCLTGIAGGPGLGRPGGFAESVVVPASTLFALPDSVSDVEGSLVEPLAVAVRGLERGEVRPQDRVCVLGAGSIGFMTAVALQARGCVDVVVVDPNPARLANVAQLGIGTCSAAGALTGVPALLGGPPTIVIDCSGHPSGPPLAIALLPQAGRLAMVGVPFVPVPTDYLALVTKELTVVGSIGYSRRDFQEALDHVVAGRVATTNFVTAIRPLEDADEAIRDLASGTSSNVKILLSPRAPAEQVQA